MTTLDAVNTAWPIFVGVISLVIVMAKMHQDVGALKDKVKTLFELFNNLKK